MKAKLYDFSVQGLISSSQNNYLGTSEIPVDKIRQETIRKRPKTNTGWSH